MLKCALMIADVLEHVQTNDCIRAVTAQIEELGILDVQAVCFEVGTIGKPLAEMLEAIVNYVQCHHLLAFQQVLCEISQATADLDDPLPHMLHSHARLPSGCAFPVIVGWQ